MSILLLSLTIILAPLYILRSHLFIPFTLLEVLIFLSFLSVVVEFARDGFPFKLLVTPYNKLILLFLFSAAIAISYSPNQIGGLGIFKAYFVEPVLFFYCLKYESHKHGLGFVIKSFILGGIWLSLMGLMQKITGSYSLAPNEIAQGRISAVFNSANSLALFLGPVSALCFSLYLLSRGYKKWVYLLVFLLFCVTTVFTRSRGGLIALTLSICVLGYTLLAFKINTFKKYWYILPVVIILLISAYLKFNFQTNNFLPTSSPYTEGDTLQIRYFIWAGTINLLKDHFFLGAGLDGFKTLYSNQYRLPQFQEEFQYPHNLFLTFWSETGLFGLISFLLILISSFASVIRHLRKNNLFYGAGLLAAFSYLIIHGVVDVPYFKNDLSLQFWALIALVDNFTIVNK